MKKNPLSDVSSRKKREPMPKVSFARDIKPLFRAIDISHMKSHRIKLDDYTFMSKPDNANKVHRTLRRTMATRLPCHPAGPIGPQTSSRCSPTGRRMDTSRELDHGC